LISTVSLETDWGVGAISWFPSSLLAK